MNIIKSTVIDLEKSQLKINFASIDSDSRDFHLKSLASHLEIENCPTTLLEIQKLNQCSGDSCMSFYSALRKNSSLTELDIFDSNIGDTGAQTLADVLKNNIYLSSSLSRLCLSRNNIGDKGVQSLSKLFRGDLCSVDNLVLSSNNITDKGLTYLTEALKTNSILEQLYLCSNTLTNVGVKHLGELLNSPTSQLITLNLHGNNIGDIGCKYLCDVLKRNKTFLNYLYLSNSGITDVGATYIFSALETNISLIFVNLRYNDINSSLLSQISKRIEKNQKRAKNYVLSIQILKSQSPDFSKALELAQTSLTSDGYPPGKLLINSIMKQMAPRRDSLDVNVASISNS